MTLINAELLAQDIVDKRKEFLAGKIKRFPASNFRASDIHECDRYLCYSILNWQDRLLHDEGLQAIFDRGNKEESIVIQDLSELNFKFIAQQTPIEIKGKNGDVICRGSIDGKILFNGEAIPVEIKSMNVNTFNALQSIDDFKKKPLHRRYLRQMTLYLFGNNEEAGLFILTDLQGHYRIIIVELDYGECEYILQRLERTWGLVKKKEYADRIEYSESLCGRCAFRHICLTEVKNEGAKLIDNEALEKKLERREELKDYVDEYESIDKEVKTAFNEIPQAFVGKSWQILGKWREVSRVDTKAIPDDIKKQYTVMTKSWITKILKI